jgi:hypothetical protein
MLAFQSSQWFIINGDLGYFGPNQMVKPFNDFILIMELVKLV